MKIVETRRAAFLQMAGNEHIATITPSLSVVYVGGGVNSHAKTNLRRSVFASARFRR